jgi:hypothetical protein
MRGIQRANLDVLLARRPVTVKSSLSLMMRIVRIQEEVHRISRGYIFRPQGARAVEDTFGMMSTVVLLGHSLNAGINAATVQFNNIRKTRSAMSNYERTTAPEMQHAALAGTRGVSVWDSLTPPCTSCGLTVSL